jgi:hypothetical protein
MRIKRYSDFTNEEAGYIKNILLSTLLSLGISKSQAQALHNDQTKLAVVDAVANYNKDPKGLDSLKVELFPKVGYDNTEKFLNDFIQIRPDNTIVIKPSFVDGLRLDINPRSKAFEIGYHIKF